MALIPCTECGGQVSTRALSCPHCGCPTSEMKPVIPPSSKHGSAVNTVAPVKIDPKRQVGLAPLRSDEEGVVRHARPVKEVPGRASQLTPAASRHSHEDSSKKLKCLQCGFKVGVADIQCPNCHVLITKHYCSHCSELIPDHSGVCPLCGKEDREHFAYASRPVAKIATTAAVSVLFFILVASIVPGHRVKMQSQALSSSSSSQKEGAQSKPPSQSLNARVESQSATAVQTGEQEASPTVQTAPAETTAAVPEVKPEAQTPPEQDIIPVAKAVLTQKVVPAAVRQNAVPAQVPVRMGSDQQEEMKAAHQLNNQGYMLITQGRPAEAIPVLEKSIRTFPYGTKDPYYRVALSNLARALQMARRSNLPVAELKKAIQSENHWQTVARTVFTEPAEDDDTDESDE